MEKPFTNSNISSTKGTVTDIDVKESELRQAVRSRIAELEQQLAVRDNEVLRLQARLQTIQEDYQFNYNFIKERDAALHEASTEISKLQEEITAISLQSDTLNSKWHDAEQLIATLREQIQQVEADRDCKLAVMHDTHTKELQSLQTKMETDRHNYEEELARREKWYNDRLSECESNQGRVSTTQREYMQHIQESHETEVSRLCTELENVTRKYHETSEALHALELKKHELTVEVEALKKENAALQQRVEGNEKERANECSVHAEQVEMLRTEMQQATCPLESALKEESSRARQLERESNKWQRELCEVQESMHRLTMQCEEEQQLYLQQMREHDARCLQMHVDMSKMKELHDKSRATLEADVSKNAHESLSLQEVVTHKNEEIEKYRQSLQSTQDKLIKTEAELQLCKCEVERYKEDARHSTVLSEQSNTSWSSQCQQLSESLRESNAQLHELKITTNTKIEQLQSETRRLTRELHSSEAARRVLEDQLHLSCDVNAQTAELQTLRNENELLQRQVVELTSANEEIRSQIGHFTNELQNDPLILSAKQNQQELQQVQQELFQTRDEVLRLKDNVRSKDEEINRYQLDLLKLQMLQPSFNSNTLHTHKLSHELFSHVSLPSPHDESSIPSDNNSVANNKYFKKMEEMYKSLRTDYDKLRVELHEERKQRDREQKEIQHQQKESKGNTMTGNSAINNKNRSNSSCSSSSSSSSSNAKVCITEKRRNDKRQSGKAEMTNKQHPHSHAKHEELTNEKESTFNEKETSNVMNEAELWRRKYFVLEHHVRVLLREREKLQRELRQCKHEIATLRSEKESLIEINSLLKAQVREAYKLYTHYNTTNESLIGKNKKSNISAENSANIKKDDEVSNSENEECVEVSHQHHHHHTNEIKENRNLSTNRTNPSTVDNLANGEFDAFKARELLATAMELLQEQQTNKDSVQEHETREDKSLEQSQRNNTNAKSSLVEKTLNRRLYYDDAKEDYNDESGINSSLCRKQEWGRHRTAIIAPTSLHTNRQQPPQQQSLPSNQIESKRSTSQQRANSAVADKNKINRSLHGYRNAMRDSTLEENVMQVGNGKERIALEKDTNATGLPEASPPSRKSISPYVASRIANVAIRNKLLTKSNKPTVVRRGGQVVRHYGFE